MALNLTIMLCMLYFTTTIYADLVLCMTVFMQSGIHEVTIDHMFKLLISS